MKNLSDFLNQSFQRYYYYNGARVYLNIDPDLALITFKESKEPLEQVNILTSVDQSDDVFPELDRESLTKGRHLLTKLNRSVVLDITTSLDATDRDIESIGQVFTCDDNSKIALTNQVFVEVKEKFKTENLSSLFETHQVVETQPFGKNTYLLTLDLTGTEEDSLDVANSLFETGYFEFAEPNFFRSLKQHSITPNDPLYPHQWHLPKIQANSAWCWSKGENITIGIMDTGINTSHPDLRANFAGTYDPTGRPLGADSHGTQCAGCAVAVGDNGVGVAGVAYASKFHQIRIGYNPTNDPNNVTIATTDSWIIGGIDYAIQNNIDIISASISIGNPSAAIDARINNYTINGRSGRGGIMLASTGNNGSSTTIGYPARHPNVFAVGASNVVDQRADFSNYGGYVEFLAPGVFIMTTSYDGGYNDFTGTSAACPVAAGTAALLLSYSPLLTRIMLRDNINFNCDKVDPNGRNGRESRTQEYGYGRVNPYNFFAWARGILGPSLACGSQQQYTTLNVPPSGIWINDEDFGIWSSSNPNLPVSARGMVSNPSGNPGRTLLSVQIPNICGSVMEKIVVFGSYPEEVWAISSSAWAVLNRSFAGGNNSNRKLRIANNRNEALSNAIYFGYAPSIDKSTLNPPDESELWIYDQGWNDRLNSVTSIEIISIPSTWIIYAIFSNSLLIGTTGDASGELEIRIQLPCGPTTAKFYIEGFNP